MRKNYLNNITGDLGKAYIEKSKQKFDEFLPKVLTKFRLEAQQISKESETLFVDLERMCLGGKKIRPALIRLGYELSGENITHQVETLAVFIELFHTGLLIHDDIMDDDVTRRGSDSLHIHYQKLGGRKKLEDPARYGTSMAINSGDLAFYLSWRILHESDFEDAILRKVSLAYSQYAVRLIYGQTLDVSQLPISRSSRQKILDTMRYKTAEYTGALPLEIGALLAGFPVEQINIIRKYGTALGWAFQIQDDVLGMFGTEHELGKPIGTDISGKKNTLLMLELLEKGSATQKRRQKELLHKKTITPSDIEEMRQMLIESGAYDEVISIAQRYAQEAIELADSLDISSKHRAILQSLAVYMIKRMN